MSADDILFAPILPPHAEEKLREIVRRVVGGPRSDTTQVTQEIVELLRKHGFTDDQEIAEIMRRVIRDIDSEPRE